jgi:hypothetical protein
VSAPATEDSRSAAPEAAASEALAALDLFALGRQATAARDARWDRRGFFVRARHLDIDGIVLFPFKHGESDAERLERLAGLARVAPLPWGIMPAPVGEAFGLDTLRCFALCRLALPDVPHLLADVATLGPRLAQMAFGFGAD